MPDPGVGIGGRDIVALLMSEARKKPKIAALIEQAAGMSDAEIDALKTPLPWYKKALKMVSKKQAAQALHAQTLLDMEGHVIDAAAADPSGTIREYTGDTRFINVDRGGGLEVKGGTLIWFPFTGGVWFDTAFSSVIDPRLAESTVVRTGTKSEYNEACRVKRNGSHINVPHTVVDGAPTVAGNGLFTIFR